MPEIPINQKPFVNVDQISNKIALTSFIDFDKDDAMSNQYRHGLQNFVDLGTGKGIDGIFHIVRHNFIAVFSDGKLFKVTSDGTATEITGANINKNIPVSYVDFGSVGYFANKSRVLKWTYNNSTCAHLSDGDAPTQVTHLGILDTYMIALESGSSRFEFSDVNDPDSWLGEYASAESRPDPIYAMFTNFGEIILPGSATIEYFADSGDPTQPFQRLSGAITERGTFSPYSFAQIDNSYFFMDTERRVVRLAGRQPSVISNEFDKKFQELERVDNAIGYHFNAEGATKYVLTFPTDLKTYVYDYKLQYWSEWSFWNKDTGQRELYKARAGRYIPPWNKYISGCHDDGILYIATQDWIYDGTDDIIPELVTARIDWEKSNKKSSSRIQFKLKRGVNGLSDTDTPKLYFSKRDDGRSQWSNEREIKIGDPGDELSHVIARNLGIYRDRQYRVRMQGGSSILVRMDEDFEVIP